MQSQGYDAQEAQNRAVAEVGALVDDLSRS